MLRAGVSPVPLLRAGVSPVPLLPGRRVAGPVPYGNFLKAGLCRRVASGAVAGGQLVLERGADGRAVEIHGVGQGADHDRGVDRRRLPVDRQQSPQALAHQVPRDGRVGAEQARRPSAADRRDEELRPQWPRPLLAREVEETALLQLHLDPQDVDQPVERGGVELRPDPRDQPEQILRRHRHRDAEAVGRRIVDHVVEQRADLRRHPRRIARQRGRQCLGRMDFQGPEVRLRQAFAQLVPRLVEGHAPLQRAGQQPEVERAGDDLLAAGPGAQLVGGSDRIEGRLRNGVAQGGQRRVAGEQARAAERLGRRPAGQVCEGRIPAEQGVEDLLARRLMVGAGGLPVRRPAVGGPAAHDPLVGGPGFGRPGGSRRFRGGPRLCGLRIGVQRIGRRGGRLGGDGLGPALRFRPLGRHQFRRMDGLGRQLRHRLCYAQSRKSGCEDGADGQQQPAGPSRRGSRSGSGERTTREHVDGCFGD
ncbi:hypothetical protein ACHMW5_21685 (plasmid) [Azospirillum melinis]|uniref:hypothetical protein n=1 Tax=Azospirillum melinis TaxID=328839 RepID=UPI003758273F